MFMGEDRTYGCSFCGNEYEAHGVQVMFDVGYDICPMCLLKDPRVVAMETTHRPARNFHPDYRRWFMHVKGFAKQLKAVSRFEDLPGGILAVKVAEAYRETINQPKARKGKAA
jgi:hypothetical protein